MHTPIVIGNWKMNPASARAAVALAQAVKKSIKKQTVTTVVVAPPTIYTSQVRTVLQKTTIAVGAQHVLPGPVGAQTGNVSVAQVKESGVAWIIIGHSEQRKRGQTNAEINATVLTALKQGLTPVICIGEEERDSQAAFYQVITKQIQAAMHAVPSARYKDVVIAYEPVWAIGTGVLPTSTDVYEMKLFIEKVLSGIGPRAAAKKVRVIYGGSVTAASARGLFIDGHVDGFLVGGASLEAESFAAIVSATTASK